MDIEYLPTIERILLQKDILKYGDDIPNKEIK
jgi:hypothetical protein